MPTAQAIAYRPEPMQLCIVYEDDQLLVVDKPAGLVVHPAAGNWSGTLLNGLVAHHAAAAMLPRAGIVHRLDKDTSGLMVVAKTLPAMTALVRAIAARDVQRIYLALAHGEPAWQQLRIEAPIGRDPAARVRMAVLDGGKPARTDVECLQRGRQACALRCTLHTAPLRRELDVAAQSGVYTMAEDSAPRGDVSSLDLEVEIDEAEFDATEADGFDGLPPPPPLSLAGFGSVPPLLSALPDEPDTGPLPRPTSQPDTAVPRPSLQDTVRTPSPTGGAFIPNLRIGLLIKKPGTT